MSGLSKRVAEPGLNDWSTYRRLLTYAYPYRWRLLVGLGAGIIFGAATFLVIISLRGSLVGVFGEGQTEIHRLAEQSFGSVLENMGDGPSSMGVTVGVLAILVLATAFRGAAFFTSKYYVEWVGHRVVMDLRNLLFVHLNRLSMQYLSASRTGELMSRTTNDTQLVERGVSTVIGDLISQPFVLVAALAALVRQDARLAAISLLLFPICIVPVSIFGRRVRRYAKEGQGYLADLASIQQEAMTGARIVKAFGMEAFEQERFGQRCRSVFRRQVKVTAARASIMPLIEIISVIGACLVLVYAQWVGLSWDKMITFLVALVAMYDPVKKLSRIHLGIQQSSAAADRIFEILDTPVTVKDHPGAHPMTAPVRSVAFEHIHFAYGQEPVLRDIDLEVAAGECIALVGSSGSGKTTLVGLLPRFFDPLEGAVRINGEDIRTYTLKSLREQIGLVTQDTILFNDTVANNIAYGREDTARERIVDAAKRAHAHDFIMELSKEYDSVIGERGMLLSGGQRQRLAIARALLRNPPILILDEATSALDTESERQVQAALDQLMVGRTVFAIAHRLSTIRHAQRIVVLDQGAIVEIGTHEELLARGGRYKYLYDLQFQDQEEG